MTGKVWMCGAALLGANLLFGCGAEEIGTGGDGAFSGRRTWLQEGPIYQTHPYYYDGTFRGLTEAVPSMAELGVRTVYLMPIWEITRPDLPVKLLYWIKDYYRINPAYGTPEELKELVRTVHRYGMKILFDLVTATTFEGSETYKWNLVVPLADLKRAGLALEYVDVEGIGKCVYAGRKRDAFTPNLDYCEVAGRLEGETVHLYVFPYPFFGPALDRTNPEAIDYFARVAEYYVAEYDIDGWRVDAPPNTWNPAVVPGDHSILPLLRRAKEAIARVKPEAVLIAETAWTDNTWTLRGGEPDAFLPPVLDEVCEAPYSYGFYRGLAGRTTSEAFVRWFSAEKVTPGRSRLRFLETGDTARIAGLVPAATRCVPVLIGTVPGIPMIQTGQEVGAKNDWGNHYYKGLPGEANPRVDWLSGDYRLRELYKKVLAIRKGSDALKYGSIRNAWKAGGNVWAYVRTYGEENVAVVVNVQGLPVWNVLDLPFAPGAVLRDELSGETFAASDPRSFSLITPAYGARILTLRR